MDQQAKLISWAKDFLPSGTTCQNSLKLSPVTGDAGFRQYFRLNVAPSLILVYAPPQQENNPAFVSKGLAMARAGVHVPEIHAVDFQAGFMLLEDLGDDLLQPLLNGQTVASLYGKAEETLYNLHKAQPDRSVYPDYSREVLMQEMALFPQWFLEKLLGLQLTDEERALLDQTFESLAFAALTQPQVVVHRDYHSRNLLLMDSGDIGVVDYQDAVIGPVTYDLVSLLKDCYIRWPIELVRQRALAFMQQSPALESIDTDESDLLRWFDWMGLQRHIKVLGIFARLWLRDGKERYLSDLPLVLRYTLEVTCQYTELKPFNAWFEQRILPLLPEQPWYQDWTRAGD